VITNLRPHHASDRVADRASASLTTLVRVLLSTAVALVLVGALLAFVRHGELPTATVGLRVLPSQVLALHAAAWLTLGILVFLATPPVLITCLTWCLARSGERAHALVSGSVLILLLSSLTTSLLRHAESGGGHLMVLSLAPEIGVFVIAAGAGTLGATLGLGGGVFVVPVLSVFFGVPLKTSIAASAVAVVVNSLGGTTVYLRHRMTNVRLGLFMEMTTVVGAIVGGLVVVMIAPQVLRAIFGLALIGLAVAALRQPEQDRLAVAGPDPLALRHGFHDPASGDDVEYVPQRLRLGASVSMLAGLLSGMLGIGGGVVKVPLLHTIMRVPVKAAAATSMFMVGITVSASAYVYYAHHLIDLSVTGPAVLGMPFGSIIGANLARRVHGSTMIRVLVVILVYLGVVLLLQALGIHVPGESGAAGLG
jgi:uncharacterized membrane protein YfcA